MKKRVLDYFKKNYNKFSKSFKKISEYVEHNQSILSFLSINELAKKTDTSPATITRFTRKLGFTGYTEFQSIFQKEVEKQTSHMKELKSAITDTNNPDGILANLIGRNIELLQEIDVHHVEIALDQAVEWINKSRKIYILGARGSYALAYYFYFMLKEFKEGVELMISGASDFTDKLLYSQKDDVLFTISFYPYTNFTMQITEFFRDNGNKIITVTDKEDSSLGNMSDLILTTKNGEKEYSFVPGIVILNALLIKLGVENKKDVIKKLGKLKNITDRFGIYKEK
ncbi:MAG: MurR/RpiR family transcriptional regulator [Fusobacteriaceae bacterium]|jgi:DNA-binding MurR/RpiR family transcriptional regulator|nr:MurR/RpiR family transcriptional regulator [Fusobacteriaceae bacterium]